MVYGAVTLTQPSELCMHVYVYMCACFGLNQCHTNTCYSKNVDYVPPPADSEGAAPDGA